VPKKSFVSVIVNVSVNKEWTENVDGIEENCYLGTDEHNKIPLSFWRGARGVWG
jgi:hypothetical protein